MRGQPAGGLVGNCGIVSGSFTQGWTKRYHTLACGCTHEVSSSVPAFNQSIVGVASTSDTIGEPQAAQKRRCTGNPLSPLSSSVAGRPDVNCNDPLGMPTFTENAPPDWRRQCEHWRIAVISGSAVQV